MAMAEDTSPAGRIQSIVKKSLTAVSLLRDPKSDQWCIYELARCAIEVAARSDGRMDPALYEHGIELLQKTLEDAVNERPLKASV
jgi:hypothetical protein